MKPTKYQKYDILLVEWIDITQDGKWHNSVEIAKARATTVKSVGFFLCSYRMSGKLILKLAGSVTSDGDSDTLDIPYGCINNVKVFSI